MLSRIISDLLTGIIQWVVYGFSFLFIVVVVAVWRNWPWRWPWRWPWK